MFISSPLTALVFILCWYIRSAVMQKLEAWISPPAMEWRHYTIAVQRELTETLSNRSDGKGLSVEPLLSIIAEYGAFVSSLVTFVGSGKMGTADGIGWGAKFTTPVCIALDRFNPGVVLVAEYNGKLRQFTTNNGMCSYDLFCCLACTDCVSCM